MKNYGIPYMGSKTKILSLIHYLFEREYKCKYFIDMFCGGLLEQLEQLQRLQRLERLQLFSDDWYDFYKTISDEILKKRKYLLER